jgi:hypothetical protein
MLARVNLFRRLWFYSLLTELVEKSRLLINIKLCQSFVIYVTLGVAVDCVIELRFLVKLL